jgi:hypothetical protein
MSSYYEAHKPQVLEKARREVKCECGFTVKYSNLSSHRKTAPHIIWLHSRKSINAISDKKETD